MGWERAIKRLLKLPFKIFELVEYWERIAYRTLLYRLLHPYVSEVTLNHINEIRQYELTQAKALLPDTGKLLEIGAGTGGQARRLSELGYVVTAVEVPPESDDQMESIYKQNRVYTIIEYDGYHLPFDDQSFDIVFSSNVLEHISHSKEFQQEILRVLKDDGCALHILPNTAWRFYSNVTHYIRGFSASIHNMVHPPPRHGENGNFITEHYYFNRVVWRQLFSNTGWQVVSITTNHLLYTGYSILDNRLSLSRRRRLSRILGACCNIYFLRKNHL